VVPAFCYELRVPVITTSTRRLRRASLSGLLSATGLVLPRPVVLIFVASMPWLERYCFSRVGAAQRQPLVRQRRCRRRRCDR